uniref:Uncharacterized protein n=1 Tax=Aegilops tauschii subsp. strangulata TaxID=200361 RepID=A0A453ASZ5_AEGTS
QIRRRRMVGKRSLIPRLMMTLCILISLLCTRRCAPDWPSSNCSPTCY